MIDEYTSIRMGFGRFTTQREVEYVVEKIFQEVEKLRSYSPLYLWKLQGKDYKELIVEEGQIGENRISESEEFSFFWKNSYQIFYSKTKK